MYTLISLLQYSSTLREGELCNCLPCYMNDVNFRPLMDDKLGKTFPEDQARGYFIQLMLGLEYCKKGNFRPLILHDLTVHHQKVIHRDIKPSNLLVADDNKIKVNSLSCDYCIYQWLCNLDVNML